MRQVHIAMQSMELDNFSAGRTNLDWTCSNGVPLSLKQLTNALVAGGYMTDVEMRRNLSVSQNSKVIENAFNIFATRVPDDRDVLLIASKNWLGIASTHLAVAPFDNKFFLVMKKGGDGRILKPKFINDTNAIGAGGQFNYLPLK